MWLPLLAIFIGLAWAGRNEYQKVEAYRDWADGATRAKYDVRAALIQKDKQLLWGRPTRSGIVDLQTFDLQCLNPEAIAVIVDGDAIALENPPDRGKTVLLRLTQDMGSPQSGETTGSIPFTDITLAVQWANALRQNAIPSAAR